MGGGGVVAQRSGLHGARWSWVVEVFCSEVWPLCAPLRSTVLRYGASCRRSGSMAVSRVLLRAKALCRFCRYQ
jgi:hypothetical protein